MQYRKNKLLRSTPVAKKAVLNAKIKKETDKTNRQ